MIDARELYTVDLRIVARNFFRGPLAKKIAALEALSPDVGILPELGISFDQ
jgi:hypothetical protein